MYKITYLFLAFKYNYDWNFLEVNENIQQETKPVSALMGVVKDSVAVKARPGVSKGRGRPINTQTTEVQH